MATKIAQQETVSTKLIGRWEQVCPKLAALAQEIPANKFDYKPVDGVRTVAEILRHAAFWNLYVADAVRQRLCAKRPASCGRRQWKRWWPLLNTTASTTASLRFMPG
jgi:DinB superfamily